jgi:DNA repair protein RecO (recombination protein O)
MPLVTVDAIILQAFPYSDTSKILRLLTASHGVQSVIARGALRPRSRYGGVLEPFTDGVASFHFREQRDLHNLSEFELTRPRQRLGRDLVRFGSASLIAEIVLRTGSEQAAPEVFARAREALSRLEAVDTAEVEAEALAQAWALVTVLGFGPALERCAGCGDRIPDGRELYFDYAAGGLQCGECGGGAGSGRVLPAAARRDLVALCNGMAVPLSRTGAHWQLLSRFLAYHLVDDRALRSLGFLASTVEAAE